jgi:hypothetical protein
MVKPFGREYSESNEDCTPQSKYEVYSKYNEGVCVTMASSGTCQSMTFADCSGKSSSSLYDTSWSYPVNSLHHSTVDSGSEVQMQGYCYGSQGCAGDVTLSGGYAFPKCNTSMFTSEYYTFGSEGASCFETQLTRPPTVSPTVASESSSTSSEDPSETMSGGAIAGVTIGVAAGIGLMAFGFYYFKAVMPIKEGLVTKKELSDMHNSL